MYCSVREKVIYSTTITGSVLLLKIKWCAVSYRTLDEEDAEAVAAELESRAEAETYLQDVVAIGGALPDL